MSDLRCPICGNELTCNYVDIGVGVQQCSPYGCENCHYVEPENYDIFGDMTNRPARTIRTEED